MNKFDNIIGDWLKTSVGVAVKSTVKEDRKNTVVYPQPNEIFRAFRLTNYDETKVVILGQDPYHNGVADGLAFSVRGSRLSPSLKVIQNEILRSEFGQKNPTEQMRDIIFKSYQLDDWAKQGVLLMNTALTVRQGAAGSHSHIGWHDLTETVLKALNEHSHSLVYMLWGKEAKAFSKFIDASKHEILTAVHPQAQNYNPNIKFEGCDHFRKANQHIVRHYESKSMPINWAITK